jgi:heterotetrameric sarcosine oxidase gamma subunit
MAEIIVDTTALAHLATSGRRGRSAGAAGVALSLVRGRAVALVIARKGQTAALATKVREAYGVALPEGPRCAGDAVLFAGIGHGQWLALRAGSEDGFGFESDLRARLGGLASINDQTDARVAIRVAGPRAPDLLAKLVPIDLDARAFPAGSVASSVLGHISATVLRSDQSLSFEILVSRSYAESLWRAMVHAGTEFGIDVT